MSIRSGLEQVRPHPPSKMRETIVLIGFLAIIVVSVAVSGAEWSRLADLPANVGRYFSLMAQGVLNNPFEEPYRMYWDRSINLMLESVQMAWVGTLIGAVLSLPCGFLAARNVSPAPVVAVMRQILNAIRAVPELIIAIVIMMPIFGLGPLAGTMALGVGAVGTLGKLTSEAIEGIDPGPVEAARSSGAPHLAVMRWSVLPQVLPEVVAFWLYRFEINIRASAVLGVIGAGGIGSLLSQLFNRRDWEQIGIALVVIILVTIAVDMISGAVRSRIISGGKANGKSRAKTEAKAMV